MHAIAKECVSNTAKVKGYFMSYVRVSHTENYSHTNSAFKHHVNVYTILL